MAYGYNLYYDSGLREFDEISIEEYHKIAKAHHRIKEFIKKQGASRVDRHVCNVSWIDYFVLPSPVRGAVSIKTLCVPSEDPKEAHLRSVRDYSLEVHIVGIDDEVEADNLVRSFVEIFPPLQPDYRDWIGPIAEWNAKFDEKYRN